VLSLIERAEKAASQEETEQMEARLRKGQFTFDDFLQAQKMLRRMGPLQGILKMMPGMGQLADTDVDEGKLGRAEAIVLSMTPRERSMPHTIDGHRRLRIAKGSGTDVQEVNQLLEARKMMEKMMGQMGKGKMPALPGMDRLGLPGGMPGAPPAVAPLERRSGNRKRKANKKRSGRR
jgi:signal recognition particle subunit SRP54